MDFVFPGIFLSLLGIAIIICIIVYCQDKNDAASALGNNRIGVHRPVSADRSIV